MAAPTAADNPYEPGTARHKLWERRRQDRAKKAEAEKKPPKSKRPETDDKSKRRKSLDDAIEGEVASRVRRMRDGQSSDSNNDSNFV
jgi:hypothetical protein